MYVIIAGGGKVGANVMRSLLRLGHEVTLIEQRRDRFERLEEEFEHQVQRGEEPSTIRSAPLSAAALTIASPMELARTVRPTTFTP